MKAGGSLKVIAGKGDLDSLTFDGQKNEWVCTCKLDFSFDRPDEGMTIKYSVPTDVPEAGACIAVLDASVTTSDLLDAVKLYVGGKPIEDTPYKDFCYDWMDSDKSQGDKWVACFAVPRFAVDLKTELDWDIKETGSFEGYNSGEVTRGADGVFRVTNSYAAGS